MALLNGSYSKAVAHPYCTWTINFSQTGRTATSATYNVSAKMKLDSGTSYGYGFDLYCAIYQGGTLKTTITLKSDAYNDNGGRYAGSWSRSATVTLSTDASGGTIGGIEVYTYSNQDTSRDQQIDVTGEVSKSAFNTAPSLSGSVTLDKSGTISESTSSVKVSWPGASDAENNVSKYRVIRYVNGNNDKTTEYSSSTRSCTDDISGVSEGSSIYYKVDCYDSYSLYSSKITSPTIYKNKFTPASLSISGSIGYWTESLSASISGASNTDNNTSFSYKLKSSNVTVYNGNITSSNFTISIQRASESITGPYIKLSDLKNVYGKDTYSGTLIFIIETTNHNGTTKSSNKNILVNLRTGPSKPTNISIGNQYTINGSNYYIPNKKNLSISWTASTEYNGLDIYYNVYYKINNGSWIMIKEGVTGTSHTISLPSINYKCTCYFKVRAISYYNNSAYSSDGDSSGITIHYWNAPNITISNYSRTETTAKFTAKIIPNTSISDLTYTAGWRGDLSGTLLSTIAEQTKTITGLNSNTSYNLVFYVKDNSGFMSNTENTITFIINKAIPVMDIFKDKIEINVPLSVVSGKVTSFNEMLSAGEYLVANEDGIEDGPISGAIYGKLLVIVSDGPTHNNSNNWIWQIFYRTQVKEIYFRSKTNDASWLSWDKLYNTSNKPTASDVNALPISGGVMTGSIRFPSNKGLEDAKGNIYLTNNSGSTIISSNSDTVYIRPNGNSNSTGQAYLGTDGIFNASKVKTQQINGDGANLFLQGGTDDNSYGVTLNNGSEPYFAPYTNSHKVMELGWYNTRHWSNLWLGEFNRSTNGYSKMPNGMYMQWGYGSSFKTGTNWTVTFPMAFPNGVLFATAQENYTNSANYVYYISSLSKTGMLISKRSTAGGSAADSCWWFALGF